MDIINHLRKLVNNNEEIVRNYKFIGLFGSILIKENFGDIDLITIGNDMNHKKFLSLLKSSLKKEGYEVDFFRLFNKKPKQKNRKHMLIHEIHYKNVEEMLEDQWKGVIIDIKRTSKVLYGSKDIFPDIKYLERDFYEPIYRRIKKIKSDREYINFQSYLIKIIPYIYKNYPELQINETCDEIFKILKNKSLKESKKDIEDLLKKNL